MRPEPAAPPQTLAAIRGVLAAGAQAADAPLLLELGLLLDLAGETMRARLFVVQAEGGAEACLRPDFTVAVARAHLDSGASSGRYFYEGPAFRAAARPGEPDEFVQMGVEQFEPAGAPDPAADAAIAALAWRAASAGGRGDLELWLGDVALFSAFVDSLAPAPALAARLKRLAGRPRLLAAELARADQPAGAASGEASGPPSAGPSGGQLAALLSGLAEPQAAALLEEVWALAGIAPVGGRGPADVAARLVRKAEAAQAPALTAAQAAAIGAFMAICEAPETGLARVRALAGRRTKALDAALEGWRARLAALTAVAPAERLRFAPALGHAFDYYDGLTFEVRSAALGAERPVAVGGRYDGLIARLGGGASARAVGCMVRPWRAFAGSVA
jgi:ATP phosphoribosyltransferase regulatory subunit